MGWVICALLALAPNNVHAAQWHRPNAPIRFRLELTRAPTHESAGYFVTIPDGGVLPRPEPVTEVVTDRGKSLASYTLWHCRASGMAVVFEDPGRASEVYVYVEPGNGLRLWKPETDLTPSAILCTDPTSGKMSDAKALSRLGTVGPTVHYYNYAGPKKAPLSIGGDLSGRPRPAAFYMLAHVVTTDPGKTWIAPFTIDGTSETRVDGTLIVPTKRIDKWGGIGQWVNLKKGLHRVEILQACGGTGNFFDNKGGLMYLTWRTPNASMDELGGVRSEKAPMAGTSRQETRVLRAREIARSGACRIKSVSGRDGVPVPYIDARPVDVLWIGNERPLIVYELSAETADNPDNTTYEWSFADGAKVSGEKVLWWFHAGRECQVGLTAALGGKQVRCTKPFYSFATLQTSLEDPATRERFRKTALNVLSAYPAGVDPTANWDDSIWNNFFRTMELGKGQNLLTHIFSVRWSTFKRKLSPERQQVLLDIFMDSLPRISPQRAIQWTEKLEKEAGRDKQAANEMKVLRAEYLMYYLGDLDQARTILAEVIRARGRDPATERAKIRYGDTELLLGNLNEATAIYGEVQNQFHHEQPAKTLVGQGIVPPPPEAPKKQPLFEDTRKRKKHKKHDETEEIPEGPPTFRAAPPPYVADWKLNALLDVSSSENVRSLIEQDRLLEAKQALREWEEMSPLSKVSGDYILVESSFYMKLEDWARARPMLEAYCTQVDASSFIAPAAEALIKCLVAMDVPRERLVELRDKMKKKLEFHPAAKELDHLIGD